MNTFKHALNICGLLPAQAAEYLQVSKNMIDNWSRGKSTVPIGVWAELADLYKRIETAADFAAGEIDMQMMDSYTTTNIQTNSGADPLPGHAADVAGAMAILLAVEDAPGDG